MISQICRKDTCTSGGSSTIARETRWTTVRRGTSIGSPSSLGTISLLIVFVLYSGVECLLGYETKGCAEWKRHVSSSKCSLKLVYLPFATFHESCFDRPPSWGGLQ